MRISLRLLNSSINLKHSNRVPFPYPHLHVGTDICHIPRVQKLITKDDGKYYEAFKAKLFSSRELQYNQSRIMAYEADENIPGLARFLSGRFALKEAGIKACPWVKLQMTNVFVTVEPTNRLRIIFSEDEGAGEAEARGSLSHDGEYATAIVMAVQPSTIETG
jgi:holo-[acyl-carrier protein] synthase